jgi:X-Pro dipeptidyl-peptidase-like protein
MWGSSHPGAVQWLAAAERPYGLAAIAPTAASPSLYRTAYSGGALRLALIGGAGPLINPPPDGKKAPADLTPAFFTLPLADLDLELSPGSLLRRSRPRISIQPIPSVAMRFRRLINGSALVCPSVVGGLARITAHPLP